MAKIRAYKRLVGWLKYLFCTTPWLRTVNPISRNTCCSFRRGIKASVARCFFWLFRLKSRECIQTVVWWWHLFRPTRQSMLDNPNKAMCQNSRIREACQTRQCWMGEIVIRRLYWIYCEIHINTSRYPFRRGICNDRVSCQRQWTGCSFEDSR